METKIRKLEEKDLPYLEHIEDYRAKIILEELLAKKKDKDKEIEIINLEQFEAYGVFIGEETLIGFCDLAHSDEYDSYKYWDKDSKAISELYIIDIYKDDLDIYCNLLDFILNDNKESNIFFDNNINLEFNYYDQLGFITIEDGELVRLSESYIIEHKIELESKEESI